MELRQLRHFEAIVHAASFGQAAERLHLTQPALSKSIRNLEQSLGVQLLERHPGGVTLTDYGRTFLDYASLINSELSRAVEHLAELKGTGTSIVRVGAGATMMKYLMPETVRRFLDGDARHSLVFTQGLRGDLVARLRRGEIDVMIGSLVDSAEEGEELRSEPVFVDKLAVVADRSHPLAGRTATLEELAGYRWILPDNAESEGARLQHAFRGAKLGNPDVAVRVASSHFMAQWLRDGPFLSYLPRALITESPDYAHLAVVETSEAIWPPVPISVFFRRRGVMLQSTRRFINRLREVGARLQTVV